jgi:serine/threonine protein kinase
MGDGAEVTRVDAADIGGSRIRLDIVRKLGGGAEGVVWEAAGPGGQQFAVKLFRDGKIEAKLPKIRAMLNADPERGATERHIAWPLAVAESSRQPVGYTMAMVSGRQFIHATEPLHRWKLDEYHLDFFSLHWLAENLASAVEKLHALGHVCGDFKDQNVLFDEKTLEVFLIDTDSFGISAGPGFAPDSYTPEWSPPEFLRKRKRSCDGIGVEHDLFSLAVLFHHLFFSVHPFSGEVQSAGDADLSIVDAIKDGRWLYRNAHTPNPHSTPLTVVAPALQQLFRRAFVDGHVDPGARPSARIWRDAFRDARWGLRWCDEHPLHVHDGSIKDCPWCAQTTDIWGSADKAQSPTREGAVKELFRLDFAGPGRFEAVELAKRRLVANPAFVPRAQPIADRIDQVDRALKALEKAEGDDLALIEAAEKIGTDPDLKQFAQRRGLGDRLDAAERRRDELRRLDALIAGADGGKSGYLLAGERKLVAAFERETRRVQLGDAILSRYRPRIDAAKARIQAAHALEQALAGRAKGKGAPLARLESALADSDGHLGTLNDPAVTERIAAGQAVVSLSKHLDAPAEDYPDSAMVRFWNRYLASVPGLGILDAPAAPAEPTLRWKVERSIDSVAAIEGLEAQLRRPLSDFADHGARDRAVVAADPGARVSARGRGAFERSPARAELAAARARLELTERFEGLAASPDRDRDDPALLALWRSTSEREKLVLSDGARKALAAAERRLARFDSIRAIAEASPAEDEALLNALANDADDLLGLVLSNGEPLRTRVELAVHRIGLRDDLIRLIAEADSGAESIEAERKIQGAWGGAQQAREQAPGLFRKLSRVELARERVEVFDALRAALREGYGQGIKERWHTGFERVWGFAPILALQGEIDPLLQRYQAFCDLLQLAEQRHDDAVLLERASAVPTLLQMKDADVRRPSLGGLSLNDYINRLKFERHIDSFGALALDPASLRSGIAQAFESLHNSINVSDLGHSVIDAGWRAAFRANTFTERLCAILAPTNPDSESQRFRSFLQCWDEAWHPLLPGTASLVEDARALAVKAMANAVPEKVELEALDIGRSVIRWRWPFAGIPEAGAANGSCQMMQILLGLRDATDPLAAARFGTYVFRQMGADEGELQIAGTDGRTDAALVAGCVIGGVPILSAKKRDVLRKAQVLTYRFQRAGWFRGPDALLLSSDRPMLSPELKVVHNRTGMTLTLIPRHRVGPEEILIDLSADIASRRGLKRSLVRRLRGSSSFAYRIELRDPADRAWVQLGQPPSSQDLELSVGWF